MANTERKLLETIKQRNIPYLGHIRGGNKYDILRLILMGKTEGRRGPGRKRHSWLVRAIEGRLHIKNLNGR